MQTLAEAPAGTANDQCYVATLRAQWKVHKTFPSLAKVAELLGMSSNGCSGMPMWPPQ